MNSQCGNPRMVAQNMLAPFHHMLGAAAVPGGGASIGLVEGIPVILPGLIAIGRTGSIPPMFVAGLAIVVPAANGGGPAAIGGTATAPAGIGIITVPPLSPP